MCGLPFSEKKWQEPRFCFIGYHHGLSVSYVLTQNFGNASQKTVSGIVC